MNKFRLFVENFLVYGVGGVISNVIPLIMLPIVTRIMPSSEYFGLNDISNTVAQFGSALAIMGMYDAMYRLFFENEENDHKKKVCSTTIVFTFSMALIVFLILFFFRYQIAQRFFSDEKYAYIVCLSAMTVLVGSTNAIVSAPTRMQNKRRIFLITNAIGPLLSYGIAIPMLLAGYYTIALPLAGLISSFSIGMIFWTLNRSWFRLKSVNIKLLKSLLAIGVPLLPNVIIYWIFNSCDKLMITNMIGIGAAGVYSVGSKLGHASQLIYTAFAGGWQYFAFSTMRDRNQVETNSKIYEYLGVISYAFTAFICAISFLFFKIVFTEEYNAGYIIAPYLFLAPLLQMLYQIGNNQFLVIKKTWPGMFILGSGAIINIVFNLLLIPVMEIEGAAVATLLGYVTTCVIDIIVLMKCKLMRPGIRFIYISLGILCYLLCWRFFFSQNVMIGLLFCLVFWLFCIFLYREDLKLVGNAVKYHIKQKR